MARSGLLGNWGLRRSALDGVTGVLVGWWRETTLLWSRGRLAHRNATGEVAFPPGLVVAESMARSAVLGNKLPHACNDDVIPVQQQ